MVEFHDKLLSNCFGIIPESAVERYLSATGLVFIIKDLDIIFFKDLDHIKTSLGIDLVNKTGNKNIDGHWLLLPKGYASKVTK
jgi:hypothetical protein